MSKFAIQAIKLNTTQYSGIRGYQIDQGRKVESEGSDGAVYETLHSIIQQAPVADLTSLQLRTLTAALSSSLDLPMLTFDGTNGLEMFGSKAASGLPGFAAGSVHHRRIGALGLIYLAGVKWSQGSYAEAALRAMFKSSDGKTTAPLVDGLVALPTQPLPAEKLVLTALTIGGNALANVREADLAIDPKFEYDFSTGLPYPVDITGAGAKGHLAATMAVDADELDVGEGTGACSAQFTLVGANSATLGATGITFTLNAAWGIEENLTSAQGSPIGRRLMVRTVYAAGVRPLTWAAF